MCCHDDNDHRDDDHRDDGDACPDCPWTVYVLTGRPVVFVRCDACSNWFHCNIHKNTPTPSVAGTAMTVQISINQDCPKDMLNSLLRCDCLAPQVYLDHVAHCDGCKYAGTGLVAPTPLRYTLRLHKHNTLHEFIMNLTARRYKSSSLPAYTLQRRCGARWAYLERYLTRIATPKQRERVEKYRAKRLEIRDGKRKG